MEEILRSYMPIIVAVIMVMGLTWIRSGNKGGRFGKAIRNSDWHAWRKAMDDKELELEDLRYSQPKRSCNIAWHSWAMTMHDKEFELKELKNVEPQRYMEDFK